MIRGGFSRRVLHFDKWKSARKALETTDGKNPASVLKGEEGRKQLLK